MSNIQDDNTNSSLNDNIWKKTDELILKEWSDKALCYRWMYELAYHRYYIKLLWYMIPVIILSTITGTANFAQDRVSIEYQGIFAMIVGSINLFTAILTTIAHFLKVAELKEGFNIALRNWDKYNRTLKLELMKKPDERGPKKQVIIDAKKQYDKLIDDSPILPQDIVKCFMRKFKNIDKNNLHNLHNSSEPLNILSDIDREINILILPEICDSLIATKIYKPSEQELMELNDSINVLPQQIIISEHNNKIDDFKKMFVQKYGREPTIEEITDENV